MAKSRDIPTPDPVIESETEESETDESGSESESESPLTTPAAAKPQKPVAKAAATAASETDESGSESESESEKAPLITPAPAAKLQNPVAKVAAPAATSSDEESGSEYETDSESDSPPKPADTVAPAPLPTQKKPSTSSASAIAVKTPAKRAAETPSLTQETKRSKKAEGIEEGKKLFERIFNPKDQIIVLEELLKRYPISITKDSPQMDDLYECIKGRVSVPVSKAQVQAKIRRMRVKFFNKKKIAMEKSASAMTKGRKKKDGVEENGKDETEIRVYELSKQIWGNEEGPKSAMKGPKIALKIEEPIAKDEKKKKVSYASNGGQVEEWVFGEGTKLVGQEVKGELEEEWKKIRKEEARLLVERLELSLKHAKAVYNSL